MVSVYPIPPPGQDFTHFYNNFYIGGGGGDSMEKGLPEMKNRSHNDKNLLQIAPFGNLGSGVEDQNKKIRKPYTITKSRESWTEEEHDKFLEALQLFDRDWKKIEAFVGSKTVIQIRSHAQKYFLKVQKNGNSEHVPPPRPKRKAAHPYPQKAPKNVLSQTTGPLQPSATMLDPGLAVRSDSLSGSRNSVTTAPLSPWAYNVVPTDHVSYMPKDDIGLAGVTMTQNYSSSSSDRTPRVWAFNESNHQVKENQCKAVKVMPDFAQVYGYIGSIFDPEASDHLQRLKEMDPVNTETILMLMKNLSVNLVSPEFKDHRSLLSLFNAGIENNSIGSTMSSA